MTDDPYATPHGPAPQGYGQPQYGAPQAYGQPGQSPYGQQPYGAMPPSYGGMPPGMPPLANWGQRVGAYLIDMLVAIPGYLLLIPGYVMIFSSISTATECDPTTGYCNTVTTGGSVSPLAVVFLLLGFVVTVGLQVWNRWIKGGKGQSIGKKALGISLISASTGRPIGTGMAFVRDIAHFLDGLVCYLGYLWPLWDSKRQTFSDKVMGTLVIQGPPPGEKR